MGDIMYKKGDLVTRSSYNNDTVFTIIEIDEDEDIYYLKGVHVRLYADANYSDLERYKEQEKNDEEKEIISRIKKELNLDRDDYFYLPGKILHIDGDRDYMEKCLTYYKKVGLMAIGKVEKEDTVPEKICQWINEYKPSIVVITGHDAYYKRKGKQTNLEAYRNSNNFIESIKAARSIEMSHEKLIIIAGACQSNYEELIKAGANFASSPKRINIHALDPAIIASLMALADCNKEIDIKKILENTTRGSNGMGGIKTKGTMYIGYPR